MVTGLHFGVSKVCARACPNRGGTVERRVGMGSTNC